MKLKSLRTVKIRKGMRVLLRADFNVAVEGGRIRDDWRMTRTIPTIARLLRQGARLVVLSHLGRPEGKRVASASLAPVARHLSELLRTPVAFSRDCVGPAAARIVAALGPGQVALLENLRFHTEEEKNGAAFSKALAAHGDLFVNDAFSASHRAHASIIGIPRHLPSVAGLLLEEEVEQLSVLLGKPKRPFVVLMGGAKIDTKIGVMKALLAHCDRMFVGGALSVTLLAATGKPSGKTKPSRAELAVAKRLVRNRKLRLPLDVVVASGPNGQPHVRAVDEIGARETVYDIGPQTIRAFAAGIRAAKTVVWNGPMGLFEKKPFSHGTLALGRFVAVRSGGRAYGVVGGGETIEALHRTKMAEHVDWVSTGGGAMLEFLEKKTLPGLKPLRKA
ncbi:phosphoglycerate kinase [Patescibacteria group bacterium]|nr:MAG: phosphoglycerate kinase [Patescibacteria group bacterium]